MRQLFKHFLILVVGLSLFSSCREQGSGWTIDTLVPIAQSQIYMKDLFRVEDSVLAVESDNSLKLVYSSNALDFKLDDFTIPDTNIIDLHQNPGFNIDWPKIQPLVSDSNSSTLNIDNVDLLKAKISKGSINIYVTSTVGEAIEIEYTMPCATKNGNPLKLTRALAGAASQNNPSRLKETIDLSNYNIDLRGVNQNDYNTIYFYFKVEFVDKNNPDSIYKYKPSDYIQIEQEFIGITPDYGRGVFYTQTEVADSTTNDTLDVFKNVLGGKIDLEKTKVNMRFSNFIGADFQGKINGLSSVNSTTGEELKLTGDIIGQSVNLSRAYEHGTHGGGDVLPSTSQLLIDQNTTNIDKLIEIFPNQFKYDVEFTINPNGNVSGANDFLYASRGINGTLDLEIPLSFAADSLVLFDSTEVNPEFTDELENVFGGNFLVHCENWFPFDAEIQIVFVDENNQPITEVFLPNSTILAAQPDKYGIVREPNKSVLSAPYSPERLEQYYKTRKALVYLTFNTEGATHKRVYANYFCGVKIVGDLQYNMDLR